MPAVKTYDPTVLDHTRALNMLGCDDHCDLAPDDRERLNLVMNTLEKDACLSLDGMRQIQIVAENGGHLTAVISMACLMNDRNALNARGLAEIILVLTQKCLP